MTIGRSESTGKYYDMETGQEVNAAAAQTGPWESALIGAGRTVHNIGENLGILDNDPAADRYMQDLRTVNPKSTFAGEAGASMLPVMKEGRAVMAGQAALASYATGDPNSSILGRLALGAGGQMAGDMIGRVITRAKNLITGPSPIREGATDMAQQFKQTGGNLTPAQATGSGNLETLEGYLQSRVGSAGTIKKLNQANQENANKLAMDAMGVSSTGRNKLTDDVLVEAEDAIGARFSNVARDMDNVHIPEELADQLRDISGKNRQAQRVWLNQTGTEIGTDGPIEATGEALMRMRTFASKRTTSSNINMRDDAIDLIEQIDDLVEQASSNPKAYAKARDQWRTLKSLDRAGSISSAGDLNPTSAYGRLRSWRTAGSEQKVLRDNLQAASALQLPFGRSGTPERMGNPAMMPFNWLGAKAYVNAPASLAELGAGPAGNLGGGTMARGLLSPGGGRDEYVTLP